MHSCHNTCDDWSFCMAHQLVDHEIKGCHSQASLESKLLSAIANACRGESGALMSHVNSLSDTRPNCRQTPGSRGRALEGVVGAGRVGAKSEGFCGSLPESQEDRQSESSAIMSWKFLTEACVTRPWKLRT